MVAGLEDIYSGDLIIDGKRMNDVEPKEQSHGPWQHAVSGRRKALSAYGPITGKGQES